VSLERSVVEEIFGVLVTKLVERERGT